MIPDDFEDLLEALKECDGFGSAILINDPALARKLVNIGWATKNSKGSYGGTPALNELDISTARTLFSKNYKIL